MKLELFKKRIEKLIMAIRPLGPENRIRKSYRNRNTSGSLASLASFKSNASLGHTAFELIYDIIMEILHFFCIFTITLIIFLPFFI